MRTTDPASWIVALLDRVGSGKAGELRQCPAHSDPTPSLSVRLMPDGAAAVKCFAGCSTAEILSALRLPWSALRSPLSWSPASHPSRVSLSKIRFPPVTLPSSSSTNAGGTLRFEAAHPYGDRWRLVRFRDAAGRKSLVWETLDEREAWIPGLRGTTLGELPLYFEREVRMAIALGELVLLVESESSADALMARGLYATTWAGSASTIPLPRLTSSLEGAHVLLVPDNDEPGLRCASKIQEALTPVCASLTTLLPDPGQDARDLLEAGGLTKTGARA